MGESKHRKENDKFYGILPKNGLGLVVSPPINIRGSSMEISSGLDPDLLRSQLLFWDRLVWPTSKAIFIASGHDEQFLESCHILQRPEYSVFGTGGRLLLQTNINAFNDLESKEPGQWAMSQGQGSLNLLDEQFTYGRGTLVRIFNSIPVPDKEVPLHDVLEFKSKRLDELRRLRIEIDELYQNIANARDSDAALQSALRSVESASSDAIRVAKETKFPFRLSDWEINLSAPIENLIAGALAFGGALAAGQPPTSAIALGTTVSIGKSIARKDASEHKRAFNYITSIHKEFL